MCDIFITLHMHDLFLGGYRFSLIYLFINFFFFWGGPYVLMDNK